MAAREIPPRVDAIRALLANGLNLRAIARRLDLTTDQVKGLYRRHIRERLPSPPPAPIVVASDGCRWVLNERKPWRFCDAPVDRPGSAWCVKHRRIVYTGRPAWRPGVPS